MPKHKILDYTLRENTFCSEILQSCHISSASHTLLAGVKPLHPCVCLLTEQQINCTFPWLQQDYWFVQWSLLQLLNRSLLKRWGGGKGILWWFFFSCAFSKFSWLYVSHYYLWNENSCLTIRPCFPGTALHKGEHGWSFPWRDSSRKWKVVVND